MRRSIRIILTALAVMVGAAGAQAHENTALPHHKHGLEIKNAWCGGGAVTLEWKASTGLCGGQAGNKCSYTCLYQVWSDWQAEDGYRGRDAEPRGSYYRCHIERSWNPVLARTFFQTSQPSWGTGEWGVSVRDGWRGRELRCSG